LNDSHEGEAVKKGNRKWWGGAEEDEDNLLRKSKKRIQVSGRTAGKHPKRLFGTKSRMTEAPAQRGPAAIRSAPDTLTLAEGRSGR